MYKKVKQQHTLHDNRFRDAIFSEPSMWPNLHVIQEMEYNVESLGL